MDGQQFTDYTKIAAREFFYDGPHQRYLAREVDPVSWEPTNDPQLWTDYNGPSAHGDFELTFDPQTGDPLTDETMRYLAGSGIQAQQTLAGGQPDETGYLHADLIASTMLTTDEGGTAVSAVSYTAFGEPIGDPDALGTRYQYAGGWGYESGLLTLGGADGTAPITLQHVGWRWYQPSLGRFIQRDPIWLAGGLNVYAYCGSKPLGAVDPSGVLSIIYPGEDFIRHPVTKGAGVVITIGGAIIIVVGTAAAAPGIIVVGGLVTVGGTALWGGEQVYDAAHCLLDDKLYLIFHQPWDPYGRGFFSPWGPPPIRMQPPRIIDREPQSKESLIAPIKL